MVRLIQWMATAAAVLAVASGSSSALADAVAKKNVVATAEAAGEFTTLVTALRAAELVATLEGKSPFTVFAPTDSAFAKRPAGTVESLLKPENKKQLTDILTYHVVAGNVRAAQVLK